jgi:hypothetical protein
MCVRSESQVGMGWIVTRDVVRLWYLVHVREVVLRKDRPAFNGPLTDSQEES